MSNMALLLFNQLSKTIQITNSNYALQMAARGPDPTRGPDPACQGCEMALNDTETIIGFSSTYEIFLMSRFSTLMFSITSELYFCN